MSVEEDINIVIEEYSIVHSQETRLVIEEIIVELLFTENITEQIDGIKTDFVSTNSFYTGTLKVWINGLKEIGVVEINSTSFRLVPAPELVDRIEIEYLKKE